MKKILFTTVLSFSFTIFFSCSHNIKKIEVVKEPQGAGWVIYSQGHSYCLDTVIGIATPPLGSVSMNSQTYDVELQGNLIESNEKPNLKKEDLIIKYIPLFKNYAK